MKRLLLGGNNGDQAIHPWILTLRFIKHILKRTSNLSEARLMGIGRILRHYKQNEVSDIFDRMVPGGSSHDPQHFANLQTRYFGDVSEGNLPPQYRLRDRFAPFAQPDDPKKIT